MSIVSFEDMINLVDQNQPQYYDQLASSDMSDEQFKKAIVDAYEKLGVYSHQSDLVKLTT